MIYVLSDLHGREDRFDSVLRQIHLRKTDRLYILGDVIDRNPDGIRLLNRIRRAKNMALLLGNHEYMMLDHFAHPDDAEKAFRWIGRNGGNITWDRLKHCSRSHRDELIRYLNGLPLNIEVSCGGKNWLLVHGAPLCMAPETGADENGWSVETKKHYAVWHRVAPEEPMPADKTVVFGHTPTRYYQPGSPMSVYYGENRIGIDCGCAYPDGRLACLRLDDGAVFYSTDK